MKWKKNLFYKEKGSTYLEVVFAIGILVILGSYILPLFPKALSTIDTLIKKDKLVRIASYVAEYVNRWAEFSPKAKTVPFDFYLDGSELELSGDLRVNQLQFVEPLLTTANTNLITDYYKTSIKFWDTVSPNRAIINVYVWYDDDLDNTLDPTENRVSFSTILIEKRKL